MYIYIYIYIYIFIYLLKTGFSFYSLTRPFVKKEDAIDLAFFWVFVLQAPEAKVVLGFQSWKFQVFNTVTH